MASTRPPARAVHRGRHHVRPALGPLTAVPGGRGGQRAPPRTLPLHDALPHARRGLPAALLRLGGAPARTRTASSTPGGRCSRGPSRSSAGGPRRVSLCPPRPFRSARPKVSTPWWGRPWTAGRWSTSPGLPGPGNSATARAGAPSRSPSSTATCGRRLRPCAASGVGGTGRPVEWAGPLERVDAFRWDWFATLTPQ